MSGGDSGGSKKKKADQPAAATPTAMQQAFMPGFDSMIAQQLGMGGYGDPSGLLAYMNSIQTPMQIPTSSLPPPAAPGKANSGGGNNNPRRPEPQAPIHGQQPRRPSNAWRV
jgi:hypothetical protein